MAGPVDWPVSAHSISDWVTPFRISPKTGTKLSLVGSSLSSLDVPLCRHLVSAVSRSAFHEVEMYLLVPLCRHLVSAVGRSASYELNMYMLDMYMYVPLCCHLLAFDPAVRRTVSLEVEMYFLPPCFRLILTICYCFYIFFREQDIASGRSPDRNQADPFHTLTRLANLYDFVPWNYGLSGLTRNL